MKKLIIIIMMLYLTGCASNRDVELSIRHPDDRFPDSGQQRIQ